MVMPPCVLIEPETLDVDEGVKEKSNDPALLLTLRYLLLQLRVPFVALQLHVPLLLFDVMKKAKRSVRFFP